MLIDFEKLHRTYLIGKPHGGVWRFTPANQDEPRKGFYPSSHQVFSNHALQIALSIYNSVDGDGYCIGVHHCLYLLFSRKERGKYLLGNDLNRIGFHLDIGVAGELYGLAVGHCDNAEYRAVREGKAPKSISGVAIYRAGRRIIVLRAGTSKDGQAITIEVELDRAGAIALAAYCVGYGRLLYPSLSDTAVQNLLSSPAPIFRACAEISSSEPPSHPIGETAFSEEGCGGSLNQGTATPAPHFSNEVLRLHKVIWAIGNQKWPSMKLPALQAIQKLDDAAVLRRLIANGNAGDFREWDSYLG